MAVHSYLDSHSVLLFVTHYVQTKQPTTDDFWGKMVMNSRIGYHLIGIVIRENRLSPKKDVQESHSCNLTETRGCGLNSCAFQPTLIQV